MRYTNRHFTYLLTFTYPVGNAPLWPGALRQLPHFASR